MIVLDLHRYGTPGVGVFCCRDRAAVIREHLGIQPGGSVRLIVPEYVISLVPSFMCSLLCDQEHVEVDDSNEYWRDRVAEHLKDHKDRRIHDPTIPFRLI